MSSDLDQLLENGYFVLKNIIPSDFIDELTSISNKLLDEQSDQEMDEQKSTTCYSEWTRISCSRRPQTIGPIQCPSEPAM